MPALLAVALGTDNTVGSVSDAFARRRRALLVWLFLACCFAPRLSAAPPPAPLRFLALGDSYTVGEGVAAGDRWPERLVALLGERGVAVASPEVIARTGWTSNHLARGLAAARRAGPYDLVSVMVGVNDQFQDVPLPTYEAELAGLLARAVELARGESGRLIVLSIPDYGVTPFASRYGFDRARVAREIGRFNAVARVITKRSGARWVDVTPASRRATTDRALLAADGLHQSPRLHGEWATLVLPHALAATAETAKPARPRCSSCG